VSETLARGRMMARVLGIPSVPNEEINSTEKFHFIWGKMPEVILVKPIKIWTPYYTHSTMLLEFFIVRPFAL
jgi:hypothetical protein